jgi:hypothetical protein
MDAYTSRVKRQRRLLLVAPLIVVPLFTLYVWVVSAGGQISVIDQAGVGRFNLNLPGAHLKEEKGLDKMAYYKKAEQDSIRRAKKEQNGKMELPEVDSTNGVRSGQGSNAERIQQKLAELKEIMKRSGAGMSDGNRSAAKTGNELTVGSGSRSETGILLPPGVAGSQNREPVIAGSAIDHLERMMKTMKEGEVGPDPQMRELNKTLDKLIAVQHPELLADSSGRKPEGIMALSVSPAMAGDVINSWKTSSEPVNRFYDLETNSGQEEPESGTMIEAVIPETQTLVNGALVKLELRTELVIKGDRIPRGTPLIGITQLSNERLLVKVSAIRYREKVYPVALQVVDQDGLAGIYEPGSMTRETTRESTGQSISSIGLANFDPSVGGQAASAGIQLARSLAGKKIRQERVTVKTGYQVFLEDVSQKH